MSDLLTDIATLAEELVEPRQHTERLFEWVNRRRKLVGVHTCVQPGLIAQLQESIHEATTTDEEGRRSIPRSKPPLLLEALARHIEIAASTNLWIAELRIENRGTPEANIRSLVGAAPRLDPADLHELRADLRRFRSWAAVMSGWAVPPLQPYVECPNPDCNALGTLRIHPDRRIGTCAKCDHIWDDHDGGINLLAAYIKEQNDRPRERVPVGSTVAGHGGWQTRAGATP